MSKNRFTPLRRINFDPENYMTVTDIMRFCNVKIATAYRIGQLHGRPVHYFPQPGTTRKPIAHYNAAAIRDWERSRSTPTRVPEFNREHFITSAEAAELLHCTPANIYKLAADGTISYIKSRNPETNLPTRYYSKEDLLAYRRAGRAKNYLSGR